ncbi:ABC transporter substrate-binding protein [Hungatella effluvii]|uniref:ABC transporter substrate-binding protein n=1 Tax=Hungatella effluvii TaxID=1096246 RepID=UPI0022E8D43F|nr:extracellular solute-binding protein [Hungatella effluvii]
MTEKKRGKNHLLCWLAVLLSATILTAGCSAGNDKKGQQTEADPIQTEDMQPEEDMQQGGEITLMHVDAGKREFQNFISEAEEALHMKIHVVDCPINADSRHAKISLLLSSGDTTVDVISVNDEMISEFKYAGYLEPLQDDVMSEETASCFPQDYLKQMIMIGDQIYSVPYTMDILVMWVNECFLKEAGLDDVSTRKRFEQFLAYDWGKDRYSYGGAWEKTYVYNEIGQFISLFGGDYYDWSNEKTREAVTFLKDCVNHGYAPMDQLMDQYEQVNQKFMNGKYGLIVTYSGSMNTFAEAGVYGPDQIHLTPLPKIRGDTTYIATWQYVLNKASEHKEAAKRFLAYAASREGSIRYAEAMNRMPAREDVALEEHLNVTGYEDMKQYLRTTRLQARPLPQNSIEYISSMGALFQKYVTGEVELETYCENMQKLVDDNLIRMANR